MIEDIPIGLLLLLARKDIRLGMPCMRSQEEARSIRHWHSPFFVSEFGIFSLSAKIPFPPKEEKKASKQLRHTELLACDRLRRLLRRSLASWRRRRPACSFAHLSCCISDGTVNWLEWRIGVVAVVAASSRSSENCNRKQDSLPL